METSVKMTIAEFYQNAPKNNYVFNNMDKTITNYISVDTINNRISDIDRYIQFFDDVNTLYDFAKFAGIRIDVDTIYNRDGYPAYMLHDTKLILNSKVGNNVFNKEDVIDGYNKIRQSYIDYKKVLLERLEYITTTKLP